MGTLRKVFCFLGIFLALVGINLGTVRADVPGTYYTFYLNDNGGSGGRVFNNSINGTLRYGVAWGYTDIDDGFIQLANIGTLPTHTNPYVHFLGYYANGVRVVNYNGDFITTTEALTSFNTSNTALVAEWAPNAYRILLDDEGGSGSQVASNSTWSLFEKYAACYAAAQALNTTELDAAECITTIYQVPSKNGYIFDGYYTGKNGTGNKIIDSGGVIVGSYTQFTSNATIYANWIPIASCADNIIELDTGGGITACSTTWHPVANSLYTSGFATPAIVSSIDTSCVPTKDNCTFLGYWEKESGNQYYDSELNILIPEWDLCKIDTVKLVARWSCSTAVPCGYYVPENSTTYVECPEGYYCPGDDFFVPANYDQGLFECAKTCSDATSAAGACSVTECYVKCDMNCYKPNTDCPTNDFQCTYGTATVPGAAYLLSDGSCGTCDYMYQPASGNSINFCPIESCPADYYMEVGTCKKCQNGYSAPAGATSPQQCTKSCDIQCIQPTCPAGVLAHGHCEYGNQVGVGVMNQVDQTCQGTAPVCTMTPVCDPGYELNTAGDSCVAKNYTVLYKCGTGIGANSSDTAIYGQSYTALNQNSTPCEKSGYHFNGWLFSGDNTVYSGGNTFTWSYDSNTETMTAQWSDNPNEYVITYTPNYTGATQSDETQNVVYGVAFTTKSAGTFARPGYIMTGWSEPFPQMNYSYTYNITENTTLSAQWQICPAGTYEEGGICKSCEYGYSSLPGATSASECFLSECPTGQHLAQGVCEDDVVQCSAPEASYATRTWNATLGAYGPCRVIECTSGHHIASNTCVTDEQICGIPNGRGERVWDGTQWGDCQIVECDPGFENTGSACSECSNRRVGGEIAVSSYATGCEIATCMYQGQKYVLENNECRPVCETESDETGSKSWDDIRKKCVRTCNPGYKMW